MNNSSADNLIYPASIIGYQDEFIKRNCPCCGSDQAAVKVRANIQAENTPYPELKKHWTGFFNEPTFFTYNSCNTCELLYNQVYFSIEKLAELYSSMSDNTAGQNLKNLRKTQYEYFDFFKTATIPRGAYLEFGPDIGLFTEPVLTEMNFTNSYLIEPNKEVHPQLQNIMNGKKVTLLTDLFDLSIIPNSSVAAAVMIHVFDHMINPKEMITQVHKKLAPGGALMLVTHDERSLLARLLKARWPAYCLQHPQLFNIKTTSTFLTRTGFEGIKSKKSVNFFSIPYLLQHLLWSLGIGQFQFKEIPWLVVPLRLGNIITIAYKRN